MASDTSPLNDYLTTGVPGLDDILQGGLLKAGFYLLQGNPGSGKTTLALQYLFHRADQGEVGLYISLTESKRDLERTCFSHGWNLSKIYLADLTQSEVNLKPENQYSVFHASEVELTQVTEAIFREVERVQPNQVVFDGLSEMRLLSERPLRYRHQMLALKDYFAERGITVLLLDDRTSPLGEIQPESLVGGNIVMDRTTPGYGATRRRIQVTKVRGAQFREGYHDYDIETGSVRIYPRLVASEHSRPHQRRTLSSGVVNLDRMLHGGLETGTATLLIGPAGVGKSTVTMQYVAHFLKGSGHAAAYLFDETLETFFERTDKVCLEGIRRYAQSGQLHVQPVNPAELSPGAFAEEVRRAVEEGGAEIVVIDSLNGYLTAMTDERYLTTHLHELFSYLNQRGVLTMVVVAQHGLFGTKMTELDVSYLADTVLLMRYFELKGRIHQAISVFKKRTGPHERTLREIQITETGVQVGEVLTGFRGLMTGVPEYGGSFPGELD